MIGNDVVDLSDPESRAEDRHPRFDRRVFADTERALLAASPSPERVRWLLWAAKESAYKAARKTDPDVVFAPSRFVVRHGDGERATVRSGDRLFHVELAVGADHVHAVARAADDPPAMVRSTVARLAGRVAEGASGGDAVRRLAVVTLAHLLGVTPEDLTIRRDGRIPTLWLRGRRSTVDLSLSHHGRFVAFACTLS